MYALAILRYRRPLEEVVTVTDEHRAYLRTLQEQEVLIASGPFEPRNGAAVLLRVPDDVVEANKTLDAIRENDPYVRTGMAQYEVLLWAPIIGKESLDRL